MSPPIVIFPEVLPLPGSLTFAYIVTAPPAVLLAPVVSIEEEEWVTKDPAPSDTDPKKPRPSSFAPVTDKSPPFVAISTFVFDTSPSVMEP